LLIFILSFDHFPESGMLSGRISISFLSVTIV
jgi:hypothetical protein